MGPAQLAEVLRQLPTSANPNLLVGFETSDDAGVFRLSETQALVQTVDFFTPIVDDPYAYGQIAAANSLSDVYAMGGTPVTALNICCFNPAAAPAEIWAKIFLGMADKALEAGVVILGGHTVSDNEPKFGMAVTGIVDPSQMFTNTAAEPGDLIYLSKPLGTGIITTAARNEACPPEILNAAVRSMSELNAAAAHAGRLAKVYCATDVTGFGLAGHLWHIAQHSRVTIELESTALPFLEGLEALVIPSNLAGGSVRNREHAATHVRFDGDVPEWIRSAIFDAQTSGGLALFSKSDLPGMPCIGRVTSGEPEIVVR